MGAVQQALLGYGASFVGPLDDYTANLAGAWSVARRLLSSYDGSMIRIRRSSDDAEQDIGADALGDLDETAIASFVGANSAYITTIYHQNGGSNLVQTTAAAQPRIVDAGTLDTTGSGSPCAVFSGTQFMTSGGSLISGAASLLGVFENVSDGGRAIGATGSGGNQAFWQSSAWVAESRFVGISSGTAGASTARVCFKLASASDRKWQLNGGSEVSDNTGTLSSNTSGLGLFCTTFDFSTTTALGSGKAVELLRYSAELTESAVQAIQATQESLLA